MIGLIQRVSSASVTIEHEVYNSINSGILLLLGVEKGDTQKSCDALLTKIIQFRIFADNDDKMNLSLQDITGELLVVSQFTLAADTNAGKRPSFSAAMPPKEAKELYTYFCEQASEYVPTKTGKFGADMSIALVNDGPVTFHLTV